MGPAASYKGRVLFTGDLEKGHAWFRLSNLSPNDTNLYMSSIREDSDEDYRQTNTVKLTVLITPSSSGYKEASTYTPPPSTSTTTTPAIASTTNLTVPISESIIIIIVIIVVVVLIGLIVLIWWCCKKKTAGRKIEGVQKDGQDNNDNQTQSEKETEEPAYAAVDKSKETKKKNPGELLNADLGDFQKDGVKAGGSRGGIVLEPLPKGQHAKMPDKYEETIYAEIRTQKPASDNPSV